jgi:protein phosphatase
MTQPSTTTPAAASALTYAIGFRTDIGQQRSLNEDAAAVFDLPGTAAAFVVCDGMGGLQAGDAASNEAVRVVQQSLKEAFASGPPADIEAALRTAFTLANDAVNALHSGGQASAADSTVEMNPQDAPTVRRDAAMTAALMGTTCVAGMVVGNVLHVAHAGDSRAYLWRGGRLTALTEDHSYVAERVKAGDITEAEARVSKFRNMITRAIGIDPKVDPTVRSEPLRGGDTVLVCSDGLTTMLEDPEIAQLLRAPAQQRATPERAASALVDAANKKGGHDNITVLLLRAQGEGGGATDTLEEMPGGGVVDLDAPRRRSGPSPAVVVLIGLLALAALAAGVLFTRLRQEQARTRALQREPLVTPGGVASSPLTIDYARLVYEKPVLFSNYLARGDVLSYSRDGGLYFITVSTGKVISAAPDGKTRNSVATVEVVDPQRIDASARLYVASDPQGNVYLCYPRSRVIEKRSPQGRVLHTLRGFEKPEAVAVDEDGNLYVVDNNLIKVLRGHLPDATPSPKAKASPKAAGSGGGAKKTKSSPAAKKGREATGG